MGTGTILFYYNDLGLGFIKNDLSNYGIFFYEDRIHDDVIQIGAQVQYEVTKSVEGTKIDRISKLYAHDKKRKNGYVNKSNSKTLLNKQAKSNYIKRNERNEVRQIPIESIVREKLYESLPAGLAGSAFIIKLMATQLNDLWNEKAVNYFNSPIDLISWLVTPHLSIKGTSPLQLYKPSDGFLRVENLIDSSQFLNSNKSIPEDLTKVNTDLISLPYTTVEKTLYHSIEKVTGKIMDIDHQRVTVKCLIDSENKIFQVRKFDKQPLEGAVNLEINQFIEIEIYTRSGERRFLYKNSSNEELKYKFSSKKYFENFDHSSFFAPKDFIDEDNF